MLSHNPARSPSNSKIAPPSAFCQQPRADAPDPSPATPLGRLSYSNAHGPGQEFTIAAGGSYAKLRFRRSPEKPGERHWQRGQVKAFSMRARSRLLQSFAKCDFRGYSGALFVTLTYHHEYSEVGPEWKEDIKEWERRIRRRFPHAWCYWRLELQRRGAPHFHCLVFGLDASAAPFLKTTWHNVAESCCRWCVRYMARVDPLERWDQVRSYCSKYVGKNEDIVPEWPGRYWGIMNRAQRKERLITVEVTQEEAFRMRRVFKRLIRAANGYYRLGGSRSGVWVSCSNETAKRALDWASSALERPPPNSATALSVTHDDHDRRPGGIGPNNISSRPYGQPNRIDRTTRKPNNRLFDERDVERRRALRLVS